MDKTRIEWCDSTWSPITGCLHGCEYCYARGMVKRFSSQSATPDDGVHDLAKRPDTIYPFGFDPTFHRYRLDDYKNKKGRTIFVGSMTDLFGNWVPDEWIQAVFEACMAAPQHRYLFLTKNPSRYNQYYSFHDNRPENFYFGASATDYNDMVTIRQTLANSLNFLSLEPLYGDVDIGKFTYENPGRLDWVIIGAETGNRKGKVIPKREWIQNIVDNCRETGTPLFMKNSLADIWGEPLIQEWPWEG